jgi:hypothetical protein
VPSVSVRRYWHWSRPWRLLSRLAGYPLLVLHSHHRGCRRAEIRRYRMRYIRYRNSMEAGCFLVVKFRRATPLDRRHTETTSVALEPREC